MTQTNDGELLHRYVARGDRGALSELVRRHIGMVYSAARRQLGDAHLAEDVTQAVFILLSQKAHTVRGEAAMASWLFGVTRYASNNARKLAARRRYHERRAAELAGEMRECGQADQSLVEMLDEAIASLPQRDRAGVILSFFQDKTYRQVGEAIGATEEAARKRVTRAVDRMRSFFAERGVTTSALSIGGAMSAQAHAAAPAALVDSTVNLVTLAAAAPAGGIAGAIAKGVSHMWMIAKMKIAAAATGAVLAGGLVTAQVVDRVAERPATPVVHLANFTDDRYEVKLESGMNVEFIGTCKASDENWFDPAGKKIGDPSNRFADLDLREPRQYHMMLRVDQCKQPAINGKVNGSDDVLIYQLDDGPTAQDVLVRFTPPDEKPWKDFELLIGDGDWETIATTENIPERGARPIETPRGGFAFTHVSEVQGNSLVYVATDYKPDGAVSVFAVDNTGQEHFCANVWEHKVGGFYAIKYHFDVPPERIMSFAVKVRPYNSRIVIKNIATAGGQSTKPEIIVEKIEKK